MEQQRRRPTKACGRTGLQRVTAAQISFGTDLNLTTNTGTHFNFNASWYDEIQ